MASRIYSILLLLISGYVVLIHAQVDNLLIEAPASVSAPQGFNATFTCRGRGEIVWEINRDQVRNEERIMRRRSEGIFVTISDQNNSTIAVTASTLLDGLSVVCRIETEFSIIDGRFQNSEPAFLSVFGLPNGPRNFQISIRGMDFILDWESPLEIRENEIISYQIRILGSGQERILETDKTNITFSESLGPRDCSTYEFLLRTVNQVGLSELASIRNIQVPTDTITVCEVEKLEQQLDEVKQLILDQKNYFLSKIYSLKNELKKLNQSNQELQSELLYSNKRAQLLRHALNESCSKGIEELRNVMASNYDFLQTQSDTLREEANQNLSTIRNELQTRLDSTYSSLHYKMDQNLTLARNDRNDIRNTLSGNDAAIQEQYTFLKYELYQNFSNAQNEVQNALTSEFNTLRARSDQLQIEIQQNFSSAENERDQLERTISGNFELIQSQLSHIQAETWQNFSSVENARQLMLTRINANHQSLSSQINRLDTTLSSRTTGVVYIRWGHNACPSGRVTVYTGRVGGSPYSHKGGASNQVCLPQDPQYYSHSFKSGTQGHNPMYGAEYEGPINAATHENVPCAVCSVSSCQQLLMIPAKYTCPSGWTREYYGFLMAEHYTNYRSTFICVDFDQVSIPNTGRHSFNNDLYHVEASCNGDSLPCGPYSSTKELTCVVCTK